MNISIPIIVIAHSVSFVENNDRYVLTVEGHQIRVVLGGVGHKNSIKNKNYRSVVV
jgi:hypothetical protein